MLIIKRRSQVIINVETMKLSAFVLLACLGAALAYKDYAGYQVLRTVSLDDTNIMKLKPFIDRPEFDFWTEPRVGRPADIMVAPELVHGLKASLERMGLQPSVLVPDVGVTVAAEREEIEALRRSEKIEGRAPVLDRYLTYDEIQAYLDEVVAAFPSIATIIDIGSSYEGRPMRVLKLSNGPGKTGIFFDVAIHAREWAGPPTVLYAINELTENLAANQAMLDANDFFFLPMANPDGYEYTWTDDRFWRKTRSPTQGSCIGVDPNRNFDQNWAGGGVGSTCSETYPGTEAFSEPETKALSDFLIANPQITFGLSVHSCGNYLLHPWGDTYELPPNVDELTRVGREALDALASVSGTDYLLGSTANVLYFAYGSSTDWNYGGLGIQLAYTIELPCGGSGSFNPPPSTIGPITTETWEAYKVFAANIPASRG